jgi:hypothetical protein
MLHQWIYLFLTARTQQAAVAADDLKHTMTSKRALMCRWLKYPNFAPEPALTVPEK